LFKVTQVANKTTLEQLFDSQVRTYHLYQQAMKERGILYVRSIMLAGKPYTFHKEV